MPGHVFDDNHGIKTTRPKAIQEEPENPVKARESNPSRAGALEDFQLMTQDDEHEQEPKRSSRHDEEIDRRQTGHMVPNERLPSLRWRLRVPDHVLGDSGLTDLDPKLEKFAVDARCAPKRVLPRHAPDQCPDLRRDWRAASSPWT